MTTPTINLTDVTVSNEQINTSPRNKYTTGEYHPYIPRVNTQTLFITVTPKNLLKMKTTMHIIFTIYSTMIIISAILFSCTKIYGLLKSTSSPKTQFEIYAWQRPKDRILSKSDPIWILLHLSLALFEATACWYWLLTGQKHLLNYNLKSKRARQNIMLFMANMGLITINLLNLGNLTTTHAVFVNLGTLTLLISTRLSKYYRLYFTVLTIPILYELYLFLAYKLL